MIVKKVLGIVLLFLLIIPCLGVGNSIGGRKSLKIGDNSAKEKSSGNEPVKIIRQNVMQPSTLFNITAQSILNCIDRADKSTIPSLLCKVEGKDEYIPALFCNDTLPDDVKRRLMEYFLRHQLLFRNNLDGIHMPCDNFQHLELYGDLLYHHMRKRLMQPSQVFKALYEYHDEGIGKNYLQAMIGDGFDAEMVIPWWYHQPMLVNFKCFKKLLNSFKKLETSYDINTVKIAWRSLNGLHSASVLERALGIFRDDPLLILVKDLLEAGACPNVIFEDGRTPLQDIKGLKHEKELKNLLLSYGADENFTQKPQYVPVEIVQKGNKFLVKNK